MRKDLEKKTNELFDAQTIAFNDQLKWTQSEHNRQRQDAAMETLRVNQILAQQKKDREIN